MPKKKKDEKPASGKVAGGGEGAKAPKPAAGYAAPQKAFKPRPPPPPKMMRGRGANRGR